MLCEFFQFSFPTFFSFFFLVMKIFGITPNYKYKDQEIITIGDTLVCPIGNHYLKELKTQKFSKLSFPM